MPNIELKLINIFKPIINFMFTDSIKRNFKYAGKLHIQSTCTDGVEITPPALTVSKTLPSDLIQHKAFPGIPTHRAMRRGWDNFNDDLYNHVFDIKLDYEIEEA